MMKVISVEKKLPEKSGEYLALSTSGYWHVLEYSKKHRAFNASDEIETASCEIRVTHWAKLPKLPLEVRRKLKEEDELWF